MSLTATATNAGPDFKYLWEVDGQLQTEHGPVFTDAALLNADMISCLVDSSSCGVQIPSSDTIK